MGAMFEGGHTRHKLWHLRQIENNQTKLNEERGTSKPGREQSKTPKTDPQTRTQQHSNFADKKLKQKKTDSRKTQTTVQELV